MAVREHGKGIRWTWRTVASEFESESVTPSGSGSGSGTLNAMVMPRSLAASLDMAMVHGPSIAGDRGQGARVLMGMSKGKRSGHGEEADPDSKRPKLKASMPAAILRSKTAPGRRSRSGLHAREQAVSITTSDVFRGVCVYFSGYNRVTPLQLGRLVEENGGRVTQGPGAGCTHVVGDTIGAQRAQKELKRRKEGLKYVSCDWIVDSVRNGRKKHEGDYGVIHDSTNKDVRSFFKPKPK